LDGYRDSELAAWVKDDDMVAGRMGGQPFYMGRFCHSLRMSLWKEHLGIGNDDKKLLELISDPVSEEGLAYWYVSCVRCAQRVRCVMVRVVPCFLLCAVQGPCGPEQHGAV
jgi:hypothetical protein